MKISITLIEKLLNLLLIIVEFVKKQQDKDEEEEKKDKELAAIVRKAYPSFDDQGLTAYFERNIASDEIINKV